MKLQIHLLKDLICPYCYGEVDGSRCKPMTQTKCATCGTEVRVPGVFGNYLIYTRLENDPYSALFSSFDNTLERSVALRVVDPDGERATAEALLESAKRIAAINQINVAKVHLVGEHDGVQYIEEELLPGGSLQELIDMEQLVSEVEALEILRDIATGLAAVHDGQIPHLNISPQHIRFNGHGMPKITSFANHRLYETNRKMIGSPLYVSPEAAIFAAKGDSTYLPEVAADIYSLGACFYHVLSKVPPFQGATPLATVKARFKKMPPRLQEFREIHPDTDKLIRDMMRPDLDRRIRSMNEIVNRLDELLPAISDHEPKLAHSEPVSPLDMSDVEEEMVDTGDRSMSVAMASASADRAATQSSQVLKPATTKLDTTTTQQTEIMSLEVEEATISERDNLSESALDDLSGLASAASEMDGGWPITTDYRRQGNRSSRQHITPSRRHQQRHQVRLLLLGLGASLCIGLFLMLIIGVLKQDPAAPGQSEKVPALKVETVPDPDNNDFMTPEATIKESIVPRPEP